MRSTGSSASLDYNDNCCFRPPERFPGTLSRVKFSRLSPTSASPTVDTWSPATRSAQTPARLDVGASCATTDLLRLLLIFVAARGRRRRAGGVVASAALLRARVGANLLGSARFGSAS